MEGYTLTQRPVAAKRGPSRLLRLATDERLVTLTRRGEQAAFEVLVARYQARLLTFCRHILRSREDAEDILQDVFAAAFNALLADEREINVRPWLYRIARNRCLNHMRRRSAIGVDSMDIHFADMGISTGEKVFKREEFRVLVEDIGRLPETQRTALLLREMDGLSYEQVANAMETTVPGVKSLLVRARIGLAEAAEARKLSCADVRVELGAVAEGIASLTQPVRHHLKDCERCRDFRAHLRANNRALAALAPFGPLLLLKKLLVTKLGAGAGGAGATAGGGAAAAVAAGGSASIAGAGTAGAFTATAVATKAIAGIAAAALLTVGAVSSDHAHPLRLARPQVAASAPAQATASRSGSLHAGRVAHTPKVAVASIAAPVAMTMPTVAPNSSTPAVAPVSVPATPTPVTPTTEEVTTTTVFPGSTATGPSGVTVGGVTGTSGATATTGASGTTTGASGASGTTGTTGTSGTSGTTGTTGTTTGATGASGATGSF